MIKINLVKVGKKGDIYSPVNVAPSSLGGDLGESNPLQKQAMQRLFLILVGPIGLYVYFNIIEFPELTAKVQGLSGEVAKLKTQNELATQAREATKNYEEEKKKINDKIKVIENLKNGRSSEVKVLDTIQKSIPAKVWLQRIEFKAGKIAISGRAMDGTSVTNFEDVLRASAFLKDTIVQRISEAIVGKGMSGKEFFIETAVETGQKPAAGGISGGK